MIEEEWHRRAVKCRSQAAAMLDGSEKSQEAILDAWLDIHMSETDRRLKELPTSDMRGHAGQIIAAIERLEHVLDQHQYDFGSPMFNLIARAPRDKLSAFRDRAQDVKESLSRQGGNVDASRKHRAAEHAMKLFASYPPNGRVYDKQRARLAALLVGDEGIDMAPYITEAKKHRRL